MSMINTDSLYSAVIFREEHILYVAATFKNSKGFMFVLMTQKLSDFILSKSHAELQYFLRSP